MLVRFFKQLSVALFAYTFGTISALAQNLPLPTGPVILTVTGQIERTNVGNEAQFDLAMLDSLSQGKFTSTTIWTEGPIEFEGVWLSAILEAVGGKGATIRATALNDYSVDLPIEDAVEGSALLALRMNGVEMSPRDKGPVWVVYPYDSEDKFRSEVIFARSVWQTYRLEVQP